MVYSFGERVEHIRGFFLYHQPWQIVSKAVEYYYSDLNSLTNRMKSNLKCLNFPYSLGKWIWLDSDLFPKNGQTQSFDFSLFVQGTFEGRFYLSKLLFRVLAVLGRFDVLVKSDMKNLED